MTHNQYRRLLDFAGRFCRYAVMVVVESAQPDAAVFDVLKKLEPQQVSRTWEDRWPGTVAEGWKALVCRFEVDAESIYYMKEVAKCLHDWQHPGLPEDLSFLRTDESEFLVTIAHESDAYLSLLPQELAALKQEPSMLLEIVDWRN